MLFTHLQGQGVHSRSFRIIFYKPECYSQVSHNPVNNLLRPLTALRDVQSLLDSTLASTPDSPTSSLRDQSHGLGNSGRGVDDAHVRSSVYSDPEPCPRAEVTRLQVAQAKCHLPRHASTLMCFDMQDYGADGHFALSACQHRRSSMLFPTMCH